MEMTAREIRKLVLSGIPLPKKVEVSGFLDLRGCSLLTTLSQRLSVHGYLDLAGCTSLTTLPRGLKVDGDIDLQGCPSLRIAAYGIGEIGGWVWVDQSFFKDNKDHLLSLINYRWGFIETEECYKKALEEM